MNVQLALKTKLTFPYSFHLEHLQWDNGYEVNLAKGMRSQILLIQFYLTGSVIRISLIKSKAMHMYNKFHKQNYD